MISAKSLSHTMILKNLTTRENGTWLNFTGMAECHTDEYGLKDIIGNNNK